MYTVYKLKNEYGEIEFWVFDDKPDFADMSLKIQKDAHRKVLCEEETGKTYLIQGQFMIRELSEIGAIAGNNGVVKTMIPVKEGVNADDIVRKLNPGSTMDINKVSEIIGGKDETEVPTEKGPEASLFRSYVKEMVSADNHKQNERKPNTVLTVKLTKDAITAGFKEHMIFGIDDPPNVNERGGKKWLDSESMSLEVTNVKKLTGLEAVRNYINECGKDNCQIMASDPSFDDKTFAYEDSDESFEEIADDVSRKYLSGDNILMREPWIRNRAVKPESIFIAVPEKAMEETGGKIPEAISFPYRAFFRKPMYRTGLRTLSSTCLDGYTLNRLGVLIFSETGKKSVKEATRAIQDSLVILDSKTEESLPFEIYPASDLEGSIEFSPYTAFQTLDTKQKKALKSWLKADEDKRKHAVLKADISGSFFHKVIKSAEDGEDEDAASMDALSNLLAYMILTLTQATVGKNAQIFFILKKTPSKAWKAIRMEELETESGVLPQKRTPDILSTLADNEIHVLVLPGTQAQTLSSRRTSERTTPSMTSSTLRRSITTSTWTT